MAQGRAIVFNGCKPLKMGAIRKSQFSDGDVEKAIHGFFNRLSDKLFRLPPVLGINAG